MTRLDATREEMDIYYAQRAIEEAERAEREAEQRATERDEASLTAQNILAGALGMPLETAHHTFGRSLNTHDRQNNIWADARIDEYDVGVAYDGPNGASTSTFVLLDRTFTETRNGKVTENIPTEGRVDRLTVFAPDASDDWRLPVFYGLRGTRTATFTIDHEAGAITAEVSGIKDVPVSTNPLAFEAVQELARRLAETPQRVITDTSNPPRARAI